MDNKILVITTGGTIASEQTNEGLQPTSNSTLKKNLGLYWPLNAHHLHLFDLDSSNIQPQHWFEIASSIYKYNNDYSGFVILHGTDTLTESAAGVALLLRYINKPIVFTGAQLSLTNPQPSDGFRNFVNACLVANQPIAETMIVFNDCIFRATRTRKDSAIHFDAFASIDPYPLGQITTSGCRFFGSYRRSENSVIHSLPGHFNTNVLYHKVMPATDPRLVCQSIAAGIDGVLLEGYGTGNIPLSGAYSYKEALQYAADCDIPVVISTRCNRSIVDDTYTVGAVRHGAISALDMTPEVAYIKLMHVLTLADKPSDIQRLLHCNMAGEMGIYI